MDEHAGGEAMSFQEARKTVTAPVSSDQVFLVQSTAEPSRASQVSTTGDHEGDVIASSSHDPPLPALRRCDVSDSNPNSPWAHKTVLTLDGGGIKGYSSLLILKRLMTLIGEIEDGRRSARRGEAWYYEPNGTSRQYPWFREASQKATPNPEPAVDSELTRIEDEESDNAIGETAHNPKEISKYYPCHYFDYISGTSTGGLSAIMLGRLRMSIDQALGQYDTVGNRVFGRPRMLHRHVGMLKYITPKYRARDMEDAVIEVIHEGLPQESSWWARNAEQAPLESDPAQCRTLTFAYGDHVEAGVKMRYVFRSYAHPAPRPFATRQHFPLNPGSADQQPIWKIARATSAAPRYFPPISFYGRSFRDGGLSTNNPAEQTLWEVMHLHKHRPGLLLSVGTGKPENTPRRQYRPRRWDRNAARRRDAPRVAEGLISLRGDIMDAVKLATEAESTEEHVRRQCGDTVPPVDYSRFNVLRGMGDIPLDDWRPATSGTTTKNEITKLTNEYLRSRSVNDELLRCARKLVEIRRARARTERWERFAADYVYFCPEASCHPKGSQMYVERKELREHGLDEHFAGVGTPIGNGVTDNNGLTYRIACTHDTCAHEVHIFTNEEDLFVHLRDFHGQTNFKSVQDTERWLDSGRTPRYDGQPQSRSKAAEGQEPGSHEANGTAHDDESSIRRIRSSSTGLSYLSRSKARIHSFRK